MRTKSLALLLTAVMLVSVIAAVPTTKADALYTDEFLAIIGPMCTNDMRDNKILASISVAQAIWESGWGRSTLAVEANALFGIRAYSGWDGKVYDSGEGVLYQNWDALYAAKGRDYIVTYQHIRFWRAYDSWQESVNDHSALFNNMSLYEPLRENYDYKDCARLLVELGYCGEPTYETVLIDMIESCNLEQYNYDFSAQPVANVSITPKTLLCDIGGSFNATISVLPEGTEYTLTSDNTAVATVTGNTITATGVGSAVITLAAGSEKATCRVTVSKDYGCVVADGVYVKCLSANSEITIPSEVKSIASGAFKGTAVKKIIVGDNVSSIEEGAFDGLEGLTLCSYDNSVVRVFAANNSVSYINLATGWTLDSAAMIAMSVPAFTSASVITAYYTAAGKTSSLKAQDGAAIPAAELVGTGCKLTVSGATYTVMVRGDTNGDGKHSTADLIIIKSYLAGNDSSLPARAYRRAADYNGDNRITTTDYLAIFKDS